MNNTSAQEARRAAIAYKRFAQDGKPLHDDRAAKFRAWVDSELLALPTEVERLTSGGSSASSMPAKNVASRCLAVARALPPEEHARMVLLAADALLVAARCPDMASDDSERSRILGKAQVLLSFLKNAPETPTALRSRAIELVEQLP